jgi:hypothetical protein
MDDGNGDRELLAALRRLAAEDRAALAAAGPRPGWAEVRAAGALMDLELPAAPPDDDPDPLA